MGWQLRRRRATDEQRHPGNALTCRTQGGRVKTVMPSAFPAVAACEHVAPRRSDDGHSTRSESPTRWPDQFTPACGRTPLVANGLGKTCWLAGSSPVSTFGHDRGSRVSYWTQRCRQDHAVIAGRCRAARHRSAEPGYGLRIGHFSRRSTTRRTTMPLFGRTSARGTDAGEQTCAPAFRVHVHRSAEQPAGTLSGREYLPPRWPAWWPPPRMRCCSNRPTIRSWPRASRRSTRCAATEVRWCW